MKDDVFALPEQELKEVGKWWRRKGDGEKLYPGLGDHELEAFAENVARSRLSRVEVRCAKCGMKGFFMAPRPSFELLKSDVLTMITVDLEKRYGTVCAEAALRVTAEAVQNS